MADIDTDVSDDVRSPSSRILSLEAELQETRHQLNCFVGKLAEAESNYERVQCENVVLQRQVVLLKKELAAYKAGQTTQTVNSAEGDHCQQDQATSLCDGTSGVNGTDGSCLPDWTTEAQDAAPVNIGESLKAVAEAALGLSGFVYDEASGLYYDHKSQYYYDPVSCLYYEPHSGTYYSFNQDTQTYEFHSQVEVDPPTGAYTQRHRGGRAGRKKRHREKHKTGDDHEKDRRKRKREKTSRHKRKHKSHKDRIKQSEDDRVKQLVEDDTENNKEVTCVSKNDVIMTDISSERCDNDGSCDSHGHSSRTVDRTCDIGEQPTDNCDIRRETNDTSIGEDCKMVTSLSSMDGGDDVEQSELEDGEISDSSTSSSSSCSYSESASSPDDSAHLASLPDAVDDEISSGWPPCVRVMVKSSPHLQVGSLYIVTCSGATIGREKELGHTILLPDTQVSKMHCAIQYDADLQKYVVQDHASQNGTLLNGHRISEPKKLSASLPVSHLDVLRVGDTELELHIHPGTETCDSCEPGQVMAQQQQQLQQQQATESSPVQTKADKERLRRQQLKMIKKKFGLADCAYVDNTPTVKNLGYEDKASIRRQTVGSDHPYQKDDLPASVTRAIPTENKGHKLLAKMGWKEGEGLGRESGGIQQPIQVNFRCDQSAGLGSAGVECLVDDVPNAKSIQKWRKAQQRYDKLDGKKSVPASKSNQMCWVKGESVLPDAGTENDSAS
ncbi:hypothetical protein NP493_682g01017 [Ridgeia piscesae]|uniref:Angiogenic factor with G patch and FHA domains 1 n=1 Tax=Ridgeia piscesae TaxID=27915 RepID=A0AAD9KR30_RIDPI|nr:hypothetical protein NP493_682g01017 [Ridgeia piscesae]